MKILVSSPFFYPEHAGSSPYSTDLAVYFAEHGHDVTVITGFPFYPTWEKRAEDRGKLFRTDKYRGVKILRGYLYVPKNPTAFRRMLHESSFAIFACLNFLRVGKPDCIIVTAAPLPLQLAGVIFKSIWRTRLVVHIQDLQSDAALSLGMVKHGLGLLVRLLLKLEALIYRRASWVVTITPLMKENLRRKGVPEEKLALYPNWIDVEGISRLKLQNPRGRFLTKHPVAHDRFTIAYAGNIGVKQGLEALVDLAEASRAYQSMHYFIIGDGSRRLQVEKYVQDKELTNLTFLPFMTQERYYEMLQDIDVSFISQKSGTGDIFFPGKLLGIMAMGKPLLISADLSSELATVTSNAECGLVSAPGDLDSLLRNAVSLWEDPYLAKTLGQNGYEYVQSYDRERVLSSFLARISSG
jgi:colanic acid biosynthesis glycosyl transferase WcaI